MNEKWISEPRKDREWKEYRLKVALCFPDSYGVGMANLGFLWVYELFNRRPEVRCDRFFAANRQFNKKRGPLSVETGMPLGEYDLVAFSLPYEGGYPFIPWMLNEGGIEPRAERRANGPLVLAGGMAVSSNPEPLADFLDLAMIGEAEAMLDEFVELCLESRKSSGAISSRSIVGKAASIPGVYAPSLYAHEYEGGKLEAIVSQKVSPRLVEAARKMPLSETAHSPVIASGSAFDEMFLVEMTRGCAHRCRFCLAGHTGGPFRPSPDPAAAVEKGLAVARKVGLIGTAFTKSVALGEVCSKVASVGASLSFSSVRLDSGTMEVLAEFAESLKITTLAAAPEVATPRLAEVVGKDLSAELESFSINRPLPSLKKLRLYYLVGVPGETAKDVEAIADTAIRLHAMTGWEILVSATPMVPKPFTPMQWADLADEKVLKDRRKILKKRLSGADGVDVKFESIGRTIEQAALSRGDRRLGKVLLEAAKSGRPADWMELLKRDEKLKESQIGKGAGAKTVFPWDSLSHGVSKESLWRQYEKSMAAAGAED